jgi:hypothetical protein
MPGRAASSAAAEATMTESPTAVTCRPDTFGGRAAAFGHAGAGDAAGPAPAGARPAAGPPADVADVADGVDGVDGVPPVMDAADAEA